MQQACHARENKDTSPIRMNYLKLVMSTEKHELIVCYGTYLVDLFVTTHSPGDTTDTVKELLT